MAFWKFRVVGPDNSEWIDLGHLDENYPESIAEKQFLKRYGRGGIESDRWYSVEILNVNDEKVFVFECMHVTKPHVHTYRLGDHPAGEEADGP